MQLTKSQRRNLRRAQQREENARDVRCKCGRFLGRRKIDTIDERFPGGFKHRGTYVELLGAHCPTCYPARLCCPAGHVTSMPPKRAKELFGIEAAFGELVDWSGDGCGQCYEEEWNAKQELWKRRTWVEKTFRPDQETHVVVHDVCFQWQRKTDDHVIAAASFKGKVVDLTGELEPTLTVQLAVRHPLHFKYVSAIPDERALPIAGLRAKPNAEGLFQVEVPASKLSVDSQYIVAGGRCNEKRCDETCERHTLRPIVVLEEK